MTDTRLLALCRRYLVELKHLAALQDKAESAQTLADAVLRDRPDDPQALDLWRKCWGATPASYLTRGVQHSEERLADLLEEIISRPALTEAGVRARLQVWRTVHDADHADRLLDSIMVDWPRRRSGRTRSRTGTTPEHPAH